MSLSDKARRRLVIATTSERYGSEVADAIDDLESATGSVHATVIVASHQSFDWSNPPTPIQLGVVLCESYAVGSSVSYSTFKIPTSYTGNLAAHVHWTKSSDINEDGKAVKWEVSYICIPGDSEDLLVTPTVVTVEDTYHDTGLETRIQHKTANMDLTVGAIAGYYLHLQVKAIAPDGTALSSDPILVSLDATYTVYLNQ